MSMTEASSGATRWTSPRVVGGLTWLFVAIAGALAFFWDGIEVLLESWQMAEYSHGPLIPLLSGFMFLRQLSHTPAHNGPVNDRWPGIAVMILSILMALVGKLSGLSDVVAYALIVWIGGLVLTSFGWSRGKQFWPPVVHLAFMLPLPGLFYYKVSTTLQLWSSGIGVWFLQLWQVPVFLDGNIIDLGEFKLHVAEACSGLRYLFPIMSFSYIFAVLYKGPSWHKAVLLLSAAPLAVLMNSFRIAVIGVMVNQVGIEYAEGFMHYFEGWVIFLSCVVILFGLARIMLFLQRSPMSLGEALDLDMEGFKEFHRLSLVRPSAALMSGAVMMVGAAAVWNVAPEREAVVVPREDFALFPRNLGDWRGGEPKVLDPYIEATLAANDYVSIPYKDPETGLPVTVFSAFYQDQSKGGIHSPEVCLPGGGWEMERIEKVNMKPVVGWHEDFWINRAVIQKGQARTLVYYWFDQSGRKIAGDYSAKAMLLWSGIMDGRTDGALVRLTTPVLPKETPEQAEARMNRLMKHLMQELPRFVPGKAREA